MCSFLLKESSSVRTFSLQCILSATETPQNSWLEKFERWQEVFLSKIFLKHPVSPVQSHSLTHTCAVLHKLWPICCLFQLYINPQKLLPLKRFLPQPPGSVQKRGGGGRGRGGGQRGGRGGRGGGFRGRGGGGRGGIRRTDMTATSLNYVHIFQSATQLTTRYKWRHRNDAQL